MWRPNQDSLKQKVPIPYMEMIKNSPHTEPSPVTKSSFEALNGILNFLFPPRCLACTHRVHSMKVCYRCWPENPPFFYHNRCWRCFTPLNASEIRKYLNQLSRDKIDGNSLRLDDRRMNNTSLQRQLSTLQPISQFNPLQIVPCPPPLYNLQSIATQSAPDISGILTTEPCNLKMILCNYCRFFPSVINSFRFLWNYQGRARDLMIAMKYRPSKLLCAHLAKTLSEQSHKFGLIDFEYPTNIIAPIPITRRSYQSRAFHQTGLIATTLTRLNKSLPPVSINLLKTSQHKVAQASLRHSERLKNVSGSFQVTSNVQSKSILLVEDVITTGATISAAASALLEAGAKSVSVIALARSSTWETFRFANHQHFPLPRDTNRG